jgi:signal transduction histidine kinase/putative methionine-R-sulfoxide reductase with GAF domain
LIYLNIDNISSACFKKQPIFMAEELQPESELRQEIERLQVELDALRSRDGHSSNQHLKRLQILHEIEHATLSFQDESTTAQVALKHLGGLVPDYISSSVLVVDTQSGTASLLALDIRSQDEDLSIQQNYTLEEISVDLEALAGGQPFLVKDLPELTHISALQKDMLNLGVRSYLTVPLRTKGELIGTLNLASFSPDVFQNDHQQIAQEMADSLAIAIQQARLRHLDQQRRQEAEVMRDVMAALASAGNLSQTLEIILVNLSEVIRYDRAALYLLDENQRYVPAENIKFGPDSPVRTYFEDDPLVVEMGDKQRPVFVDDIQGDPRFQSWPDMSSIQGWLGAPLIAGDEMIGFISLGSLEPFAYREADAILIQGYTHQVAQVLEKAWLHEQSNRRTEELEVISTLSFVLGQADSREGTLSAVVEQISTIFDAQRGTFLFPDANAAQLRVNFSQEESLVGMTHAEGDDLLWQVYHHGETAVIQDLSRFLDQNPDRIYAALFGGMRSAAILPLSAQDANYGILCFSFDRRGRISSEEINLFHTIADIAGASLQRAVVLEALERQVTLRTQRLSTLYNINAVSSEPLDLEVVLNQLLNITLEATESQMGTIHLVDLEENNLHIAANQNIPRGYFSILENLDLEDKLWSNLFFSPQPLVIPDVTRDERIPEIIRQEGIHGNKALISTPIRAKGIPLGLLSVFRESIQDYSVEDITLLMTIADQIGSSVERAQLITQAEQAAVIEERQRLARELHDSVTQLLYSQVLFASAGHKSLGQGEIDPADEYLNRIDQTAQQALKEMRLLVYELSPQETLNQGLIGALHHRLDAVEKRAGMDAELILEGDFNLDQVTEFALYRLVLEALNNILKHSGAEKVKIYLNSQPDRLILEIIDDGCGFELEEKWTSGGMGLATMQERAAALGGELIIESQPGHGTRIKTIFEGIQ